MGVEQVQSSGSGSIAVCRKVVDWVRNTWGRIVTVVGAAFASIDVFDVAPAQQPLADLIGIDKAKKIIGGAALICLVLSFFRHQQVATKYHALQKQLQDKSV